MPTVLELASQIITAQAASAAMSTEEIISSLTRVHGTMIQLESGKTRGPVMQPEGGRNQDVVVQPESGSPSHISRDAIVPKIPVNEAFRDKEIICLLCNKPFQRLGSHLSRNHGMGSAEYRARFGIPKSQPLLTQNCLDTLRAQMSHFGKTTKAPKSKAEVEAPKEAKRRGRPRKVQEL